MPEVHQVLDSERILRRELGGVSAWLHLESVKERLDVEMKSLVASLSEVPRSLVQATRDFLAASATVVAWLSDTYAALTRGDQDLLHQHLTGAAPVFGNWDDLIRQLRARRNRL